MWTATRKWMFLRCSFSNFIPQAFYSPYPVFFTNQFHKFRGTKLSQLENCLTSLLSIVSTNDGRLTTPNLIYHMVRRVTTNNPPLFCGVVMNLWMAVHQHGNVHQTKEINRSKKLKKLLCLLPGTESFSFTNIE